MKRFAALYEQLDQTQRSKEKIQLWCAFLKKVVPKMRFGWWLCSWANGGGGR